MHPEEYELLSAKKELVWYEDFLVLHDIAFNETTMFISERMYLVDKINKIKKEIEKYEKNSYKLLEKVGREIYDLIKEMYPDINIKTKLDRLTDIDFIVHKCIREICTLEEMEFSYTTIEDEICMPNTLVERYETDIHKIGNSKVVVFISYIPEIDTLFWEKGFVGIDLL